MRKSSLPIVACVVVAMGFLQPARAEELTAAKRADITRLLEVTGSLNIGKQFAAVVSRGMFDMLRQTNPNFPETALAIVEQEAGAVVAERLDGPDGFVALVVPLYHRHYTHAEIRQLLQFYASPLGKKMIAVMPQLLQESMAVGQAWGQSLGPEIGQRVEAALRKEGLLPEQKAPAATAR